MGRFILESDSMGIGSRVVPQNELVLAFDRIGAELAELMPSDDDPVNVEFDIPSEVSGNFIWHREPKLDRSSGRLTIGQLMIDGILIDSNYTFYHDIGGLDSPIQQRQREFRAGISLEAEREDTGWAYDRLPEKSEDYGTAAFERNRVTRFLWLAEHVLFPPEDNVLASSRELVEAANRL